MKAFLVFVFLPLAWSTFDISYSGNVTLTNNGNAYSYRLNTLLSLAGFLDFSSVDVSGTESTTGSASATAQGISGLFSSFPLGYLYSFDASVTSGGGAISVTSSQGFVGTAFPYLTEVDGNGVVVQLFHLGQFSFVVGPVVTPNPTLQYAVIAGSPPGGPANFSVSFTVVVSSVVGLVSTSANLNALVTPTSLETIVQINNFPYRDLTNSVQLTIAVATGSSQLLLNASSVPQTSSSYHLSVGSGSSAVYVTFGSQALADGGKKNIQIDVDVAKDQDFGGVLLSLLSSLTNQVSRKLVNITFPAGSQSITYDPSIGAGAPPQFQTNDGHAACAAKKSIAVLSALTLLGMRLL